MHLGQGIYKLPERSRKSKLSRLPLTSRRETLVIFAAVAIFLGSMSSKVFRSTQLQSDAKTKESESFNSLLQWDKSSETKTLYDELGIDAYTQTSTNENHKIYKYDSPYEQRFPKYKRPDWAEKTIPYNEDVPTNKQLCFCHVGKAGGSTVGCSLGFSLHCSAEGQTIPGLLPIITTHAFHRGVYDCQDDAAYFLFVIRDPLARMMSAFNYDRPQINNTKPKSDLFKTQDFYVECPFWTLNDVAQSGLLGNGDASNNCQRKARLALQGKKEFIPHWYFNYQYYYEFIPENAKLLVIRNEHIVDDWNSIEYLLGGRKDVMDSSLLPENNVHGKNSTDLYLSPDSRMALCKALCNEIQVYKTILRRAVNFIEEDVQISFQELRLQCPIETERDICDVPMPDITEKIEYRKGC